MLDEIFDINTFNIYKDNENYYFFRALNMADNNDLDEGIILENGKIAKIRTDLERYEAETIYQKEDKISLEQMIDHIKMRQRKDTNCISLSSNANAVINYGRSYYKDKYIMVKVPKEDFNSKVYEAGLYILKEINNSIETLKNNNELNSVTINLLNAIDRVRNEKELSLIRDSLSLNTIQEVNDNFENGLIFKDIMSMSYAALNEKQNLEKNKMVLKLSVLNKQVLPRVNNGVLIQTLGNAFSSLELIHYGQINNNILEVSKEKMDVLALIQQLPKDTLYLDEIKNIVINNNISLDAFDKENMSINEDIISIDNMYLMNNNIKYKDIYSVYNDAFYLIKSRLRNINSLNNLKKILNSDSKYEHIYNYIENNGFGIEKEIISRESTFNIKLSESVGFNTNNKSLIELIKKMNINILERFNDPNIAIPYLINMFNIQNISYQDKEDYIINSIIDIFDWNSFGVDENLSDKQRLDLINKLKESNCIKFYNELKNKNIYGSKLAYIIFNNVIKNNDKLDYDGQFNLSDLEMFIGYNKIINTKIELFPHQRRVVNGIDKLYKDHNYAVAVLPTGAGKSFVSLYEMLKHKEDNMLYLAPNDIIIEQMIDYICEYILPEELKRKKDNRMERVRKVFPNLQITTYQNLRNEAGNLKEDFNKKYKFIVFDELHRTGAQTWREDTKKVIDFQDENTKILGITATPERDVDTKNMADIWANNYYSEDELRKKKFIASGSMNLKEAIKMGIISNPKFINCEYTLVHTGLDDIQERIDLIFDQNKKDEYQQKLEELRKKVIHGIGIEQILHDNLNKGDKFIVFLPRNAKNNEDYIKDYQDLFRQYLYAYDYLNNHRNVENIYEKIINGQEITNEERNYLNIEKDNILLLASIKINGSLDENNSFDNISNYLITKSNDIAKTIIDYMNFDYLSRHDQIAKLKELTKDDIDVYSLYSGYGQKKNKTNLNDFNNNKTNKLKALFVLDMLNEGAHLKDVNKMIWLRPLSENSSILFHQQLGRILKANKNSDKNVEQPVVLDLVNNLLRVNLEKDMSQEQIDLNSLNNCISWICDNGMPDINTKNKEELNILKTLYFICNRYIKYINDINLLNEVSIEQKYLIEEIINIGYSIDLWTMELDLIKVNYEKKYNSVLKENDDTLYNLELSSVVRDFVEIDDTTKTYDMFNRDVLTEKYIEYLKQKNGIIDLYDKTPIGNTTMGIYLNNEQRAVKKLNVESQTRDLTELENHRIKCYNDILKVKEDIEIENRTNLTKEYIEYLKFQKGIISINDKTRIGNTTIGWYLINEQRALKKLDEESQTRDLTELENHRIKCYNDILKVKEDIEIENRTNLTKEYIEYLKSQKGIISQNDKTRIGNTTMGIYLIYEQTLAKKLNKESQTRDLTESENHRIKCYNDVLNVKEDIEIENRTNLTKEYIEYLKQKNGIIKREDNTPIGNTTMGIYLIYEQKIVKRLKEESQIRDLIESENNRIKCYKNIIKEKEQIQEYAEIEKRTNLTEKYIEYLKSQKGILSNNDKTRIGNTTMSKYFCHEQRAAKNLDEESQTRDLTESEKYRIKCYNDIVKVKENIVIENRTDLTKEYIEYLKSQKGIISINDKTRIGNATIGWYLIIEQRAAKKLNEESQTRDLTESEKHRIECYYYIIDIKEKIKMENKKIYNTAKEEFDTVSKFNEVKQKIEVKDDTRKV